MRAIVTLTDVGAERRAWRQGRLQVGARPYAGPWSRDFPAAPFTTYCEFVMQIRRASERGYADHGWLRSFHTFSFADYYDPKHMGYRSLRVINEDRVAGGKGFGTHPHRDMEILSYVLAGSLEHKDSLGTGSVIRPGDVQRMSAGTGVRHSEFNGSPDELVHFLQIWIVPDRPGHAPGYEQKHFSEAERSGRLKLVASGDGAEGSVSLHQDARLYAALLAPGETVNHELGNGRHAYVHVARGAATLGAEKLSGGDAASVDEAGTLTLTAVEASEILLFDLA